MRAYYVYILTNPRKTVLYVGVTNDLFTRLQKHYENRGKLKTFAGRYYCYKLLYFEMFPDPNSAISREKEIKGWRREKKEALIKKENPAMAFIPWEDVR
ncbi:MAG TPA: endonuclease [Cytophagales bacterium]|nr:endonuclease [Cytophagales bacterium]HAA22073.1 endonuclease [Cytophagales bacterium]HAP61958.1 endonuclease [Cytophagales bacterium]